MNLDKNGLRTQVKAKKKLLSEEEISSKSQAITKKLMDYVNWQSVRVLHTYKPIRKLREVDTKPILEYIHANYPSITIYHPEGALKAVDIIIVPLVAFDKSCSRLGHGGGYYDRFLKKYPNANKIGLAFELQKVDAIPTEPHDVKLDSIITETSVYT